MRTIVLPLTLLALTAQAVPPPLAPSEIVAKSPATDWINIAPSDLLVMDLPPDRNGNKRRVVIQLMPPPFSQGWVGNIRKLTAAHWWDGTSINRVQDNYVVQWGDANAEHKGQAKRLPVDLITVPQSRYEVQVVSEPTEWKIFAPAIRLKLQAERAQTSLIAKYGSIAKIPPDEFALANSKVDRSDAYSAITGFTKGWQIGTDRIGVWPVHCYGMVGVGRDMPPDTGTGAELYTVIGHAPRHLDRNIALVGRVIAGMEHLSSLPRGTGPLGFYEKPEQPVVITAIRLASELPAAERPRFQYLSTESASFARYADARANRQDAFFITPAGGADICNIPVPVRKAK